MTTINVCDICHEPVKTAELVTAAVRTTERSGEYHFHSTCFDERIPGLWVVVGAAR